MNRALATLMLLTITLLAASTLAQSDTAFNYQGHLTDSGSPANGIYALKFTLWDAPAAGNQIGSAFNIDGIQVHGGLFTTELDFGADALTNQPRWLEITVNIDVMSPRTRLSKSPYAVQTRGIFVDDQNNVGLGTTTPAHTLDIKAISPSVRITTDDTSPLVFPTFILSRLAEVIGDDFAKLGQIQFKNLNDEIEAWIGATRLDTGTTSMLEISVGVNNPEPQITITPEEGVRFQHGIGPPIAYGRIKDNLLYTSSSNITSFQNSVAGSYILTIQGDFHEDDIPLATVQVLGKATARISVNNTLIVNTYELGNANARDRDFTFVVYRP